MSDRESLAFALAALLVLGGEALLLSHIAAPPKRLVGYGCEGAMGPVYADEEDELPRCAAIERTDDD